MASASTKTSAITAQSAATTKRRRPGSFSSRMTTPSPQMTTTPVAEERRVVNGVTILLRKATIVSEKEKVPMQAVVAPDGAVVEMSYGSAMIGRAEPKSVAQRLDKVEIFGLTRLPLPAAPPAAARTVPGEWTLVLAGFPDRFHRQTDRQTYKDLGGGKSEVTIRAAPPDPEGPATAPSAARFK